MSAPRPERETEHEGELELEGDPGGAPQLPTIEELEREGDVEGLLALAKAYRSDAGGVARDVRKCFEAYRAAAALGSPAAEHATALFYLSGGVVDVDEREAAARLRKAADAGHLPAKTYLANLYELGIHYKVDPAKADVWYRSAARSAGITAEPGTLEHRRAMAELGSARHCLEIVEDEATSEEDRAYFLRKARAFGYRSQTGARSSVPLGLEASLERAEERAPAASGEAAPAEPLAARAPEEKGRPEPAGAAPSPSRFDWGDGAASFFFAGTMMAAALVGGHMLTEAAGVLIAESRPVPVVGPRVDLIAPILVGTIGVLPTLLFYPFGVVARAALVGALAGVLGEIVWSTGRTWVSSHAGQLLAFGAAGFLAALLVLGVLGMSRSGIRARRLARLARHAKRAG